MASILRQIVAGPRSRHPEANLDLCYVTDQIIATSGPSGTYPQIAYRNPLKDLVKFLDSKHSDNWAIWEFRAEGTGYPDEEVYNRIRHYPWPDHHPPPFALIPLIMASMRNWLKAPDAKDKDRVVVVHCKAGKGRSGTVACSYLISEEGWKAEEAKQRFTERRMRPGFGNGISIPSQVRWIGYVDRWTKSGKTYLERAVEVLEVHVWGLRDGVKIAVEGYVEEGKVIKAFHIFKREEREIVRGTISKESGFADVAKEAMGKGKTKETKLHPSPLPVSQAQSEDQGTEALPKSVSRAESDLLAHTENGGDVIFRPSHRVVLPSSDVNIDFERRNQSKYGGFTMVTSLAHVWFNTYFEGGGPERNGVPLDSGVFEIDFDAMDGIKGSSRKGTRAFDRMAVLWKAVPIVSEDGKDETSVLINEPAPGEEVEDKEPADWRKNDDQSQDFMKNLGLREATSESAEISRANSIDAEQQELSDIEYREGIKSAGPPREERLDGASEETNESHAASLSQRMKDLTTGAQHVSTSDLPDGVAESNMPEHTNVVIGSVHHDSQRERAS
nr:phosphatidylinositol 3,4,5-trisphosphate 3-phosphatase and dual-specificity protein phosphatase pten [Quercus suber]POE94770.1 phosphatidylinositol 3,4,5-trisphosphate 3-phosphatase and dual-specificity protein phosphatase pten [Quercus suber]